MKWFTELWTDFDSKEVLSDFCTCSKKWHSNGRFSEGKSLDDSLDGESELYLLPLLIAACRVITEYARLLLLSSHTTLLDIYRLQKIQIAV